MLFTGKAVRGTPVGRYTELQEPVTLRLTEDLPPMAAGIDDRWDGLTEGVEPMPMTPATGAHAAR